METAYCAYCCKPFNRVGRKYSWDREPIATCGQAVCKARTTVWNGWIKREQVKAVSGDVRHAAKTPAMVPAMSTKTGALFDLTMTVQRHDEQVAA